MEDEHATWVGADSPLNTQRSRSPSPSFRQEGRQTEVGVGFIVSYDCGAALVGDETEARQTSEGWL
jgi:hypothetical protein